MLSTAPRLSISKRAFLDTVRKGPVPPLYVEAPYTSPFSMYPGFSGPGSFLLESVKGPMRIARYSFIGFSPYSVLRVKDGSLELGSGELTTVQSRNPLKVLKGLTGLYLQQPVPHLPPFQGGAVGLLSYDFVNYLEKLPKTTRDDLNIPDAHFLMVDRVVAFDHLQKKTWLIFCPGARDMHGPDWSEKYDEAEYELSLMHRKACSTKKSEAETHPGGKVEVSHGMTRNDYMDMVRRAKEYIAAGDIFQCNLSLRLSAFVGEASPWKLYSVLRGINPSPFAGFMDFGDYFIVSSSPERLLRLKGDVLETRPIAGTRPRGRDETEDRLMRSELLLNAKERAEHVMLIDLERNDLGRVCDYGSVEVDELMTTEDYSHVIHIVSNVRGKLAPGRNAFDALRAAFPGGTITGVPKVRCMEIIDELETLRRGPYTGSMGYIGFSGAMDMNILIRSFTIKEGTAYVQAGAGIVADSDPGREYHETLKKAEALLRTLELTARAGHRRRS
jgi:para-aminobenzoate synthetase component 1